MANARGLSHPTWVRGLKQRLIGRMPIMLLVAPHVGAWIETSSSSENISVFAVAPHVGAWIETAFAGLGEAIASVAPHVGAWIETKAYRAISYNYIVAPHVGAWIETPQQGKAPLVGLSRTPRGCVD